MNNNDNDDIIDNRRTSWNEIRAKRIAKWIEFKKILIFIDDYNGEKVNLQLYKYTYMSLLLWTGVLIEIENRVMTFFSKRFFICYSKKKTTAPYWSKYSCMHFI